MGNSLAERMNLFGNFEALLHTRFPQLELVVRNFARPCDAVDNRQRPSNYTTIDDPLKVFRPGHVPVLLRLQRVVRRRRRRSSSSARRTRSISTKWRSNIRATDGERAALRADLADRVGADRQSALARCRRAQREPAALRADRRRSGPRARPGVRRPVHADRAAVRREARHAVHDQRLPLNEAGDREVAVLLDRALFGETTAGEHGFATSFKSCAPP